MRASQNGRRSSLRSSTDGPSTSLADIRQFSGSRDPITDAPSCVLVSDVHQADTIDYEAEARAQQEDGVLPEQRASS